MILDVDTASIEALTEAVRLAITQRSEGVRITRGECREPRWRQVTAHAVTTAVICGGRPVLVEVDGGVELRLVWGEAS